jgi:hypothetical protein
MIKICLSVVAGVGAVIALTVAYRKQQHAEAAEARADAADRREDTKVFNERFGSCAEQLGSDKPAIRLAGMYALAQLADDWDGGRQTCIDVLCAYLRMPYDSEPATDDPGHGAFAREQQVRHTGWRLIGDHLRPDATTVSWSGHNFDFTGAVIDGADLHGAVISGGVLRFTGATFSGGKVNFFDATFSGGKVNFFDATFSGGKVNFFDATFSGGEVDFLEATFSGGEVHFVGATFSGEGVEFIGATFSSGKVDFAGATFSGEVVHFVGATFSGGTVDLSSPAVYSSPPQFDSWPTPPAGLLLPDQTISP